MLLNFFRINDPYRLLGLIILLVIISIPFLADPAPVTLQELKGSIVGESLHDGKRMYIELYDSTAPATAVIYSVMNRLFGRSLFAQHLLALFVILFQAAYFAALLIQNKAYNDNTYVPALIFGVLCFFSFDLLSFSPELLASTVLLFALNNLFKEIEFRIQRDEITHNLGLYLGIATLLVFSYIMFLFATVLILALFTRLTRRSVALLLFGFLLPHVLLFALYFAWGESAALWNNFYAPNLTFHGVSSISIRSIVMLFALPTGYFVLSLFMLNREARFTKYQSQLFQVMFQWMLFALFQVLITRDLTPHSLLVFVPSLAYFISHYLLLIRRRWIGEIMLLIFVAGILTVNLLSKYNKVESISYTGLFVPEPVQTGVPENRKVMALVDDPGIFRRNKLAGFFSEWQLSRAVLESPEFYENVIIVDKSLRTDAPDVIIDPAHRMEPFLDRIPSWRRKYIRNFSGYIRSQSTSN